MQLSQLEAIVAGGGRIALWGWGREGRAAHRALRTALPRLPLTLFCNIDEAVDARQLGDCVLQIETEASAEALSRFAVIVKSPGISPYSDAAQAAMAAGTRFIGGTALWFAAHPDASTVCVTGTKGKSTTTALLAHLLRAAGKRTALVGNIGMPLLEVFDADADVWAIELSSYQTRDVAASGVRPGVAIVTNVHPEHLDWHGSEARYLEDKLALLHDARPRIAVLNAEDARLRALVLPDSDVRWYGREDGWHLRGNDLFRGDAFVVDTTPVPLPGRHNRGNLCAALTAIDALGIDAVALAEHAISFRPLPHRLQTLGTREGVTWVNDSISTTPFATLAALDVFYGQRVALLVGGHDRGLDWTPFAEAMAIRAPEAIVTMGQNGCRIHALLAPVAQQRGFTLHAAGTLDDAVVFARHLLAGDGVLLMSPGAPSFGAFRDYTERGRQFAQLAGFDPDGITSIDGLGIA